MLYILVSKRYIPLTPIIQYQVFVIYLYHEPTINVEAGRKIVVLGQSNIPRSSHLNHHVLNHLVNGLFF